MIRVRFDGAFDRTFSKWLRDRGRSHAARRMIYWNVAAVTGIRGLPRKRRKRVKVPGETGVGVSGLREESSEKARSVSRSAGTRR